ncbi:MAG: bifunctional [glutamate--ammonia ligase]-adenylyl-L-tyrosine phosphorylase/[glutamate--ammonia-ligase] adenylyltransferase [Ghiorsea sp.]
MTTAWMTWVPANQKENAARLTEISPFFKSLMKDADEKVCHALFKDLDDAVLPEHNEQWLPNCHDEDLNTCLNHLRKLKCQTMRHIIWWELGIHGNLEASYHSITAVAEGLLEQALGMAKELIAPRFGQLTEGSFCIVGLGKLGGRELNLGSDVDPLFLWQGVGDTEGGRKQVQPQQYFSELSKMLIKLMAEYTALGQVWPVDMRLRPGGDGAAICSSLEATLSHYLDYGQTWERAMLIKARPVAGDIALGQRFIDGVMPFVFRKYLDYSSVVALADMKRRIDGQAGQSNIASGFDVKRGRGGIREIEFTIQSMQLLNGGRDKSFRIQEGKKALDLFMQKGFMPSADAIGLFKSYTFWRRIEHAVQARKGEQTHVLPDDYQRYLSMALGIDDVDAEMQKNKQFVHQIFTSRVLPSTTTNEKTEWLSLSDKHEGLEHLDAASQPHMLAALHRIDEQLLRGLLPERSREQIESILAQAMPEWLTDNNGVQAVESFAELLHSIAGRASWIDLLATHKGALAWLIGVLSASKYLAEHIVKNPTWLEWPLANERGEAEIKALGQQISCLDIEDEADFLASLGRLIDQARIRCALAIDAHQEDPLTIGGWLSDIADVAVLGCYESCVHELKLPPNFPLVALAMGKHGSREMGLVSDLDMVFVLAGEQDQEIHQRSAREWAQRLGRRMIRQLTGIAPFGAGYEFDGRLRPSGNSGVLVTTLVGFEDYQMHEAQTWEHQALCRARVITQDESLKSKVEAVIVKVLNQHRDIAVLKVDVLSMREKMLAHLSSKDADYINLKHDEGGLVSIEFLAQFSRLSFAQGTSSGLGTVATLRNLPESSSNLWKTHASFLADTYIAYRQMENVLRVELWSSIGKLPVDNGRSEWVTLRRHSTIQTAEELQVIMMKVRDIFIVLMR